MATRCLEPIVVSNAKIVPGGMLSRSVSMSRLTVSAERAAMSGLIYCALTGQVNEADQREAGQRRQKAIASS
jgi:hypothetical protein